MKWIRERDSLISQTLAFVQTVAGKKEDADRPLVPINTAKPDLEVVSLDAIRDALNGIAPPTDKLQNPPQSAPPRSIHLSRPIVPSELQNEIRSRIEGFRAHQERFNRERAEYFNATLARLRASIDDARRIGK